ncbi:MAG: hypothetical protein K9I85_05350 [Saprospiraceae bacterium]|nr:hypothetical protein [Saprospiraceae bacterium]
MRRTQYLILLAGCALASLSACKSTVRPFNRAQDGHTLVRTSQERVSLKQPCRKYPAYVPDSTVNGQLVPERIIRVNYHILNSSDTSHAFLAEIGTPYVQELTREINKKFAENIPMSLPAAQGTPVLPTRIRLEIAPIRGMFWDDGVYYHFDDELYAYVHKGRNRNNSDMRVIKKYAIQPDSVLNIFILPHHPDSVKSTTYSAGGGGIALGKAIKLSGIITTGLPPSEFAGMTVHEIGHIMGLGHTWRYSDGCDDTPHHPNCFYPGEPPCDSLISNNVMDYNHWQQAWTPCQLGQAHRNLSRRSGTARSLLKRNWCDPLPDYNLTITDTQVWEGEVDLFGDVIIAAGGHLTIRCEVSFPQGSRLLVQPGGQLVIDGGLLTNDCGLPWQGVILGCKGRDCGKVTLTEDADIQYAGSSDRPD